MNELEEYKFKIKRPLDSTELEIDRFHDLVRKGGKVQKRGLKKRIQNCALLGYCYYKDEIVGVSAIKIPLNSYKVSIIEKSKIDRKPEELNFEIGYSFTEIKHRKKGINKRKVKTAIYPTTPTV